MIQTVVGEKALTVRLSPESWQRLDALAKREKRSTSAQAAYLIEKGLEAEKKP